MPEAAARAGLSATARVALPSRVPQREADDNQDTRATRATTTSLRVISSGPDEDGSAVRVLGVAGGCSHR